MRYEDIILRAPEPEDLELLYKWENDTTLWQLSNTLSPFSKYTLKRYIETSDRSIFEAGQLRLMIQIEQTSEIIGTVDLFDFDPFNSRAGIGILIGDKSSRKKGYAKKAVKAMIEYCFGRLKIHQLYCNIICDNKESIKLFEGLGFTPSGTKSDWIRSDDSYKDEILFQLINPQS